MSRLQTTAEILEALVGFDTTSRNSNLAAVAWIEDYLDRLGVVHERIADRSMEQEKANLWATIGPMGSGGYILSGHTDVVPVDGQSWTGDPFRLSRRDGRLYGRGSADMKGFLACSLAAVPAMRDLTRPIHLSFSYDEEVGCVGVRSLIAHLRGAGFRPAGCFVGEPTEMNVVIGHKSKRSFRVDVRGRTCHSSLAPAGVNAVEYAARLIVKIRDIADRLAREGQRDALYDIPFTTAHTGVVQGGTALNIVPDAASFQFEFRPLAVDDIDALAEEVIAYARDRLEPQMKAIAPEAGFTFEPISGFPGLDTPAGAEVVELAKSLAGRADHGKVAFGTEAGLFAQAGIATVVIGPGSIEQAHKADEFIAATELEACGAFLDRLIAHCRS